MLAYSKTSNTIAMHYSAEEPGVVTKKNDYVLKNQEMQLLF